MKTILSAWLASLAMLAAGEPVSTASLLREMTDPTLLAMWPEIPYHALQASSYDRASKAPERPGWFANADWSHFIREEQNSGRAEHVMMEDSGPGAIVRLWCTWFGPMDGKLNHSTNGVMRIYLDGGAEPVVSGTLDELFVKQGIVGPPLAETAPPAAPAEKRAHNLYLPIPYAKGCKVTYETRGKLSTVWNQGEALYYQIQSRKYPAGTNVMTFSMADIGQAAADARRNLAPSGDTRPADGPMTTLEPGRDMSVEFRGPGALTALACAFDRIPGPELLNGLELSLEFDGLKCANMPVGSFFGAGSRIAPYQTRFLEVRADGTLACSWVMPFARTAVVRFSNTTGTTVSFRHSVTTGPWTWDDRSMHFHATRNPLAQIRVEPGEKGARDVNFAVLEGTGRIVGDNLFVTNQPDGRNGDNWWGEGDEKIRVDGEDFPSHFGTGTEDYYGYGHCRPEPFSSPFHAQPYGDGNLAPGGTPATAATVNTRIRLLDDIPFSKSLRFDMELWHWKPALLDYIPTTYYYLRPGR